MIITAVSIELLHKTFRASILPADQFDRLRDDPRFMVVRRRHLSFARQLLVIALGDDRGDLPEPVEHRCLEHLDVLSLLAERHLPAMIPRSVNQTRFGIDHLDVTRDLFRETLDRMGIVPGALKILHHYIRTRFRVFHNAATERRPLLLTIDTRLHGRVDGTAAEALELGYSLEGVRVKRSSDRTYLGRVLGVRDGILQIEGERSGVDARRCFVEASDGNFERLLESVQDAEQLHAVRAARAQIEQHELRGAGLVARLRELAAELRALPPRPIGAGVSIRFGDLLGDGANELAVSRAVPERRCFGGNSVHAATSAAEAIQTSGPAVIPTGAIRIWFVVPEDLRIDTEAFVERFMNGSQAEGTRGFAATFGIESASARIVLVDRRAKGPEGGDWYVRAVSDALTGERPHAVVVIVRDDDILGRQSPYHAIKARLVEQGIPSQLLRASRLVAEGRTSGNEELAFALFGKVGGRPWRLVANAADDLLAIGLAHAETTRGTTASFVGAAVALAGDGTFLRTGWTPSSRVHDYPDEIARMVTDIVLHAAPRRGARPLHVAFHASRPPSRRTFAVIRDVLRRKVAGDLQVSFAIMHRDHPMRLVHDDGEAPERGVVVALGGRLQLLSTHDERSREPRGHGSPLLVELDDASTVDDVAAVTRTAYRFTFAYAGGSGVIAEPATLYYAFMLAGLLERLHAEPGAEAALRKVDPSTLWFA